MKAEHKSIEQLINILLDNAVKYSPGGDVISLRFRKTGRQLNLTVKNKTLSPLAADSLKHLFDRFYRSDASRNSSTGGYGIGLSIAKAIVTAHGGKIQARSEDGSYFEITVTFPI